ncbi:MAG: HEAT repeat domain-containing protein [Candidatus Hodarchaeales archaeon]|jgi:HEAT repeat protein
MRKLLDQFQLASDCEKKGDVKKALSLWKKAEKQALKIGKYVEFISRLLIVIYFRQGIILREKQKIDEAIEKFESAIDIIEVTKQDIVENYLIIANTYLLISRCLIESKEDRKRAIDYMFDAMELFESFTDPDEVKNKEKLGLKRMIRKELVHLLEESNEEFIINNSRLKQLFPFYKEVDRLLMKSRHCGDEEALEEVMKLGEPAVHSLIIKLESKDKTSGCLAARALGNIGDTRATEPLTSTLWMTDDFINAAAEALGKLGEPAIDILIKSLDHENSKVRNKAAEVLGKIGNSRAVEPLIKAMKEDKVESVRGRAAEALGRLGDPLAIEPLVKKLSLGNHIFRKTIASALTKLGWQASDIEERVNFLLSNNQLEDLTDLGDPALEPLVKSLNGHNSYIHERAALGLGLIGSNKSIDPLLKVLNSSDNHVRLAAAISLVKLGDERAIKPLVEGMHARYIRDLGVYKEEETDAYRVRAIKELGNLGKPAVAHLMKALDSGSDMIRSKAARILRKIPLTEVVDSNYVNSQILNFYDQFGVMEKTSSRKTAKKTSYREIESTTSKIGRNSYIDKLKHGVDDYYCRLCGTKHIKEKEDIACPICRSRYCLLSIRSSIEEGNYCCSWCPEKLIETYKGATLIKTEVKVLKELENQIKRPIPLVWEIEEKTGFMAWNYRVIKLGMYEQGLTNFPEILLKLTELEHVYLVRNRLTTLPESIGSLQKLKKMFLGFNRLITLPDSIGKLTNLQQLDLSNNRITTLPESIGSLQKLKKADLSYNPLTVFPESIGRLKNLKMLSLKHNQLTTLPESIGNLQKLKNLSIEFNQLTMLPESIGNLQKLKDLYIGYNQLTTLPESILKLTNLQHLSVSINPLDHASKSLLKTLKKKSYVTYYL